jgi:Holliday junction resolvase RusA-like endonuclease
MAARNFNEEALLAKIDRSRVKEQAPVVAFTYDPQEIYLPFPPSVNAMYRNVAGRGRAKSGVYRSWETAAGWDLNRQNPKRIKGPVILEIYLEDSPTTRGDADNRIKPISDFLVANRIIEGDQKKYVRRITVSWSENTRGCRVSIRPASLHGGGE